MAEKILKGINFPGLEDTYLVPEVDSTLSTSGASADAKVVGDALALKANKIDLIQSDWKQTDKTALDFIKNKPETLVECPSEEIKALFN